MSYIRKTKNLTQRLYVSSTAENADFATLKEAIDHINDVQDADYEIILDGDVHFVEETIEFDNGGCNVNIKGLGSDITNITASGALMQNSALFVVNTDAGAVTFSRLRAEHSGNSDENFIEIYNSSYHEFYDIIFSRFDNVISDFGLEECSYFVFNFIAENNNKFLYSAGEGGGSIDLEVGTIKQTQIGIDLYQANTPKEVIINGLYYNGIDSGSTFINIASGFTLNSVFNVQNCGGNNVGNFQTGFDFTLTGGTYADCEFIGNSTYEDKKPHFKINVIDNASTTTVTTAGTYYKANFVNGSTYTCKMLLEDNKYTFLSSHKKDMVVYVTGNLSANQNNRNVTIGWNKNEEGTIYSPFTIRTATANQPYGFSFVTYFSDIEQNDFGELYLTSSSNGDVITIQDLNIFGIAI